MRKKLTEEEKKTRVTVTLDKKIVNYLTLKNNKSKYISDLIYKDINKTK